MTSRGATARMRSDSQRPRRGRGPAGDWTTTIAGLAFALIIGLALYGPLIAPHDPFDTTFLYQGKFPPYDPSPAFPLGTDAAGRDRLSLLLWGARNTFAIAFAAAALRLGLGAFLGVLAGWQGGAKELWLSRLALGLSSIPATIAALMAVIAFNVYAGPLAFVLALGLVGWGDAFHQTRRLTRAEAARPYIETARTLGMDEERVVVRHLLPNIAPTLLTVGALQISAVLLLLAELALLRIFLGGSLALDFATQPLRLPSDPEWASLLGTTRPIHDLYGNTVAVLAPAGALLTAVVTINLLADALARRAQRLDVFHLWSLRQLALVLAVAIVLVTPALLWPSRLSAELAYARGFDADAAFAFARELAGPSFEGRVAQSPGAAAAADVIAERLHGTVAPIHEQIVAIDDVRLEVDGRTLERGDDLAALTPRDATVRAPLVVTSASGSIGGTVFNRTVTGRVVVVATNTQSTALNWAGAVQRAEGVGLIVLSDDGASLSVSSQFPLPTIRTNRAALRTLLGRELPTPPAGASVAAFDVNVSLSISTAITPVEGVNVLARVPGSTADAPLLIVAAPYDALPSVRYLDDAPSPDEASATAVLVAAASRVREAPLPAEVLFIAVGSQIYDSAGLKSALRGLDAKDRQRLTALIWVPTALGRQVTLRSDPLEAADPVGSTRVAARVASALDAKTGPQLTPQVARALDAVDLRAVTFEVSSVAAADAPVTTDALTASGRTLLTLLAYAANHPEALT